MKKGTKVMLIVATVLIILGIGFILLGAFTSAGNYSLKKIFNEVDYVSAGISDEDFNNREFVLTDTFDSKDIYDIVIDLNVSALKISMSDDDKCRFYAEDGSEREFNVYEMDSVLYIEDDDSVESNWINLSRFRNNSNCYAVLELPEKQFENFTVQIGMGCILIENISVECADIDCEMGYIQINDIYARSNEIDCEMGSIIINNIETEQSNIDCEMGKIEAVFSGNSNEYDITENCEMGKSSIHHSKNHIAHNKEQKNIYVDCEMGTVDISFTE